MASVLRIISRILNKSMRNALREPSGRLVPIRGTPIPLEDDYCKKCSSQIDSVRVRDAFACFEMLLGSPTQGLG